MGPQSRRRAILALANDHHEVSVEEIARRFAVSHETARRDLARLDADGLLRRVHGGALKTATEPRLSLRMGENPAAKQAIAATAARLFEAHDTLMIDAGSTTAFFASALAEAPRMTLVTNSLEVASRAGAGNARHRVYLLGGEFRAEAGEVVGSLAVDQLGRFTADHAVLTVGALDAEGGVMDFDVEVAMVARAMLQQARSVTVLADATKFDRLALVRVCEFDRVARLVTDRPPGPALAEALRRAGTAVLLAE
jgi:DeoR family glycerol-3-phosphate regulon repressor